MKYIVSLIAIIGLAGCSGTPGAYSRDSGPLEGVVYTGSGAPLRDAEITLDERASVWSDVNGRFTIPRVRLGTHRVSAHHDAHEAVELTMTFSRPTDVVYLRLLSAEDLVRATQHALDRGATSEADELIARALAVAPDSVRARYLAAIVSIRAGRPDDARAMLDRLGVDAKVAAIGLLDERLSEERSR